MNYLKCYHSFLQYQFLVGEIALEDQIIIAS